MGFAGACQRANCLIGSQSTIKRAFPTQRSYGFLVRICTAFVLGHSLSILDSRTNFQNQTPRVHAWMLSMAMWLTLKSGHSLLPIFGHKAFSYTPTFNSKTTLRIIFTNAPSPHMTLPNS